MFLIYPLSEKDVKVKMAIERRAEKKLIRYVKELKQKGINCLDLCFLKEKNLFFVLDVLRKIDIPLSIDTHNKSLLIKALKKAKISLINSSYPDKRNLNYYLNLASQFNTSLVVLSAFRNKYNVDLEKRRALINKIVKFSERARFPLHRLFIDLIILPLKYYKKYTYLPLVLSSYIKKNFSPIRSLAGLDNFTYQENNPLLTKFLYLILSPTVDAFITREYLQNIK
jgi:hypothetical protein